MTADTSNGVEIEMPVEVTDEEAPSRRSSIDPLAVREGRDLVWKDVNMTLAAPSKSILTNLKRNVATEDEAVGERKLLDNVWGEVPKKQITAIMGPSGSGKTSLLNVLSGRARTSGRIKIESDVRLNNYAVDPADINVRRSIAFVAQDDSLQTTATPREAIRFSAKLRLPSSMTEDDLDNLTEKMLAELGLVDCADTIIGGALIKGISGGERKRTSVGVELITQPALVFLDEATSGLDSFNALQLCQLLQKVANAGSSVLFTIHQPSSEIFNSFDHLILLNKGRVMYQGSVANVPVFFGDCGHSVPVHYNPADFIMMIAQSIPIQQLMKDGFFRTDDRDLEEPFPADEGRDALGLSISSSTYRERRGGTPVGMLVQIRMLFAREMKNMIRAKHALTARTAMTTFISLLVGCIFYQVADSDFTDPFNVQSTFGALLMALLANVFSTALPGLIAFPEERPVFLREYSTNHYTVTAYFASRLTTEIVITAFQVSLSTMLTYLLVGFSSKFGAFWLIIYTLAMTSTALAALLGCSIGNPSLAIEFLPLLFMPQILFAGFFVSPDQIPVWLRWIQYICPLTYAVRIALIGEFDDRCDFCDQLLNRVEADPDEKWWYWLILICLFVTLRLLALFFLRRKATVFY